jgi:hypothetical protein
MPINGKWDRNTSQDEEIRVFQTVETGRRTLPTVKARIATKIIAAASAPIE